MTKRSFGFLFGALLSCISAIAFGQSSSDVSDRVRPTAPLAGEFYVGPHIGYSFIGKFEEIYCPCNADQNDFLFGGLRFGHFFTDHLAAELTAQYFRPDRDQIHDYWELTLGALYDFTPRIPGWNTYLAAGGGVSRMRVFSGRGNGLAYVAGGSEYRFSKLVGMRLELKGQYNFHATLPESTAFGTFDVERPGHMDVQPSIGVLLHFGGKPAPVVIEPAPIAPPAPQPAPAPPPETPAAPPVVTPPPAPAPPPPTTDVVLFDQGKSRVTNIAKAKLDEVALRLRENPRATVEIVGYPDSPRGARQEKLARDRAEHLKQYLTERHGIDGARIRTRAEMTDTAAHEGQGVLITTFPRP
jgi:hypothetical protein